MEVIQISGNDIVGITKTVGKDSKTTAYTLTVFPVMFEIVKGNGWRYYEMSISVFSLFQLSVNTLV